MKFLHYNIERNLYLEVTTLTNLEIECFLAICEHKTISRAAEKLYITQPSLSSRLKTLERELGGELFIRQKGNREITLTNAGKEFYTLALQYQELTNKMHTVCRKAQSCLRISSLNSLDTFLLPQVYDLFLQEHPEIELEIQNMELQSASHSILLGDTDLAFTTGNIHDATLKQSKVFKEPMVVVCNKSLSFDTPVTPQKLLKSQELLVDWSSDFAAWHNEIFGERHPKLTVSIMTHIKQFLESKPCWAIVPLSVAKGLLNESKKIKTLSANFDLPHREISIVTLPDGDKNTAINYFLDCLKRTAAEYLK